ncbi:MAG: hypothetical protein EOO75_18960, partial [Myxococcales bacterium]
MARAKSTSTTGPRSKSTSAAAAPKASRASASSPAIEPPGRLSEVRPWLAAHAADPRALAALAWAPRRRAATHDACLRALLKLGGAAALDALATYRGQDAGSLNELGDAWDDFDRCAFARRVLASPVTLVARGGLARLDGVECVESLDTLWVHVADRCSLEPLRGCPELISLSVWCEGDIDLTPAAALPALDRLVIHGQKLGPSVLEPLRPARVGQLDLELGPGVDLGSLAGLARLRQLKLATARPALAPHELEALRGLVGRGAIVRGFTHQPWTVALGQVGGQLRESHGHRDVFDPELNPGGLFN